MEEMLLDTREVAVSVDTADDYAVDIREMREAIARARNGEISGDEFKRFRLHRGIYGQRADQQGFSMIRIKVPYGLLTSLQVKQIGNIAMAFADGLAHVTTRQDIQLHWAKLGKIRETSAFEFHGQERNS